MTKIKTHPPSVDVFFCLGVVYIFLCLSLHRRRNFNSSPFCQRNRYTAQLCRSAYLVSRGDNPRLFALRNRPKRKHMRQNRILFLLTQFKPAAAFG